MRHLIFVLRYLVLPSHLLRASAAIESFGTPWHHAGAASRAADGIAREHQRQERERRERRRGTAAPSAESPPRKKTMEEAIESAKRMRRVRIDDLSDVEASSEDEAADDGESLPLWGDGDDDSSGAEEMLFGMPRFDGYGDDFSSSCDNPGFGVIDDDESSQDDSDSDERRWRKKRLEGKKLRKAIKKKTHRKKRED
uniref:Mitochondrial mRNA-processing protein COX24 C-terminal domain-containing protein n=1 Tax=Odontella aurita TaxID=265563 RepID=A0A7S4N8A0_9STRA|mmetsp:Transcript_51931/g.155861  ORF Transcript_51931/g.155861 Transcript_51931/m.155861 type:complete len:197 (+) Transcript_51931:113-703(+)